MISYCTTLSNPWIVPNESNIDTFSDYMLVSAIEFDYEAIYSFCVVHSTLSFSINWVDHFLDYGISSDSFSHTFSTNERIMEITMSDDAPWDNHHHYSSFLDSFEDNVSELYRPNVVEMSTNFISIHDIDSKNNFSNIEEMTPLDILMKSKIVKNVHIVASFSPD